MWHIGLVWLVVSLLHFARSAPEGACVTLTNVDTGEVCCKACDCPTELPQCETSRKKRAVEFHDERLQELCIILHDLETGQMCCEQCDCPESHTYERCPEDALRRKRWSLRSYFQKRTTCDVLVFGGVHRCCLEDGSCTCPSDVISCPDDISILQRSNRATCAVNYFEGVYKCCSQQGGCRCPGDTPYACP